MWTTATTTAAEDDKQTTTTQLQRMWGMTTMVDAEDDDKFYCKFYLFSFIFYITNYCRQVIYATMAENDQTMNVDGDGGG
jgi:hypothetical protein